MAATLMPATLALLAFCILCETAQQLGFKLGADRAGAASNLFLGALGQPLIWLGVGLWVVESIGWIRVLQRAPLSLAYPVMTLSYATVPLVGVLALKERLSRRQIAGATLIFVGVGCVALSGGA